MNVFGAVLGSAAVLGGGYLAWQYTGANKGGAKANASKGVVHLAAPAASWGTNPITITAHASGISSPVYQFWYKDPAGTWHQDKSGYRSSNTFQFTPSSTGTYTVIAYARTSSAPTGEDASQRTQYEANSGSHTIWVVG